MDTLKLATRRWWYIMPIVFITYSLAYLDRANYGFAAASGMAEDLMITPGMSSLLGALFLVLEWIAISLYAYMGLHMRRWFAEPRGKRLFNRCCAGLLSAAATVLLMARRA